MKNSIKIVAINFIILIILLLIVEGSVRIAFSISNKDSRFLLISDTRQISISSVVKVKAAIYSDSSDPSMPVLDNKMDKLQQSDTIYPFGGSTTKGYNCGSSSSSWPAELRALSGRSVINYAESGQNSDDMLLKLFQLKEAKGSIIWASRFNASAPLMSVTHHFNKNKHLLNKYNLIPNPNFGGKYSYDLKRISVTIQKYSLATFYLVRFNYMVLGYLQSGKARANLLNLPYEDSHNTHKYKQIDKAENMKFLLSTNRDYVINNEPGTIGREITLENWVLNLKAAREYVEQTLRADFYVLILPIRRDSNFKYITAQEVINSAKSLGIENIIDASEVFLSASPKDEASLLLCDGMHQRKAGNHLIANFVNQYFTFNQK